MSKTDREPDLREGRVRESPTIKQWPARERPRERLIATGAASLSDAELLAILIRSGSGPCSALDIARQLLVERSSLRGLAACGVAEMQRIRGIGAAKAAEIAAAFEIGRRVQAEPGAERVVIRTPEDVARLMIPRLRERRVEVFMVLMLDARNAVKGEVEISRGTLNASLVHPREVFKAAIDSLAAGIIVVHNHPSGNAEPSPEDLEITRQLAETGRIIGIPLHDHLIVAGDKCTSLAERGAL